MAEEFDPGIYNYWLVTKGKNKGSLPDNMRLTPILLTPVRPDFTVLLKLASKKVLERSGVLLADDATEVQRLAALTSVYAVELVRNLYWSRVALGSPLAAKPPGAQIEWRVRQNGLLPESWQGPADGIIPARSPVTIRDPEMIAPAKLNLIEE